MNKMGLNCGYFPKATKTVLIVKHSEDLPKAKSASKDTGVQVTVEEIV